MARGGRRHERCGMHRRWRRWRRRRQNGQWRRRRRAACFAEAAATLLAEVVVLSMLRISYAFHLARRRLMRPADVPGRVRVRWWMRRWRSVRSKAEAPERMVLRHLSSARRRGDGRTRLLQHQLLVWRGAGTLGCGLQVPGISQPTTSYLPYSTPRHSTSPTRSHQSSSWRAARRPALPLRAPAY